MKKKSALTPEQWELLHELERRQALYTLRIHQARLMCSALRREIRLSLSKDDPFSRLRTIRSLSDALAREIGELRV